jgi:Glycosyl transferases group 1
MMAKRVLIVGPTLSFKPNYGWWVSSRSGLMFYAFGYRLANGFVRNGCFVLTVSDRDSRNLMFNWRAAGVWHANRQLLHVARELQPDLLLLHHCDLISPETVARVRKAVPRCRVAAVFYDDLSGPREEDRFRGFLTSADFGFATTGGATLAKFADVCPVAFIPNPVDLSMDNTIAYSVSQKTIDVFTAMGGTGEANRWEAIDVLTRLKPNLRYALHGRSNHERLLGDAYYQQISRSKVGLNLSRSEGDLYASDRMAQFLGNGLLLTTDCRSGYDAYFNDEEMIFFSDIEELGDKIEWAVADDTRWRAMAERGRAKALATMEGRLVADFIMRMTFGLGEPDGWQFSSEIYGLRSEPSAPVTAPKPQSVAADTL